MGVTVDEALGAWEQTYAGLTQVEIDRQVRGMAVLVRGIAARGAVTPEEFAQELGIPLARTGEVFAGLMRMGLEFNAQGSVVGAALSVHETAHRIRIGDRKFHAWCALDTFFIPGLLGETAYVESTCPVTGDLVRLTIAPEGVAECAPAEAVLTVVMPSGSGPAQPTGPTSPT